MASFSKAPALTSAAIIAALGYTPASAGAVLMLDGTAALPGMSFALDVTTGFYKAGAAADGGSILGIAQNAKSIATLQYRVSNSNDNLLAYWGTAQTAADPLNDVFVATFSNPNIAVTNAAARVVGFNIGSNVVTYTAGQTYTQQQAVLEMDKIDAVSSGGALTINKMVNTRFRTALPDTGVAIVDNLGIDFVVETAPLGTQTNIKYIRIPNYSTGATNFYGVWLDGAPNGGAIASAASVPVEILSGGAVTIKSANTAAVNIWAGKTGGDGAITLNGLGTSGRVYMQTNSVKLFEVGSQTGTNYLLADAQSTPTLTAKTANGSGNATLSLESQNSGTVRLRPGGVEAFNAKFTSSGVNRPYAQSGATGGAAVLGTESGTDTNVDLRFILQGAGVMRFGTFTATGGETYAGYITIKDAAGNSRKLAVFA